jgi:chromatin assembly factor 1 subunit B
VLTYQLWQVESHGEDRKVTYLSTLTRHSQSVNVVRFSPKGRQRFKWSYNEPKLTIIGDMLASAGDDGNVIFWVPSETVKPLAMGEDRLEDKETWREKHMCRTSSGAEIYDLAWSPDGVFIITGGVDNTARIFNAHTGSSQPAAKLKMGC